MLGVDESSAVWSAQLRRRRDVVVLGVLHWSDGLSARGGLHGSSVQDSGGVLYRSDSLGLNRGSLGRTGSRGKMVGLSVKAKGGVLMR